MKPDAPLVQDAAPQQASPAISGALTAFLAAAVGAIALNLYASQPLLGLIGPAFGLSTAEASLITTLTLLGYAAGLVFLVPLVDLASNRRLICVTLACGVASLAGAAAAPSAGPFLIAAFLIGVTATVIQMLVPIAAALAPEARRGSVVGNVMSGLMLGTLLSRPIAGLIADAFGWRAFFAASAVLMAALTIALAVILPRRRPQAPMSYGRLIASLGGLLRREPLLRRRGTYQFLLMGAFSVFWTAIALKLAAPPYGLAQRGIALFALAAAGAVLVAPIAGRQADRGRTAAVTALAQNGVILSALLAWIAGEAHALPFGFPPLAALMLLAVAAFGLSAGVTADQIVGRHAINMIRPEARGRTNGLYTGLMFLGGSLGALAAGYAWSEFGWPGVCLTALAFGIVARVLSLRASA